MSDPGSTSTVDRTPTETFDAITDVTGEGRPDKRSGLPDRHPART
ncbi:hypothetical protein FHS29_003620 [Saccharothrix tamanrassetensis]|uniref:Uncharacterized protein n=1 Tax=Saccharothrix tamanrassetensis TaxID=1051531 RepID=A0A841CLQ5_9PSEU|nr:hypothetical protein [Saccharothrix tamanrassetensis]MBB5957027.1 hypothetical protein [Saccharothrix tamanrassetensis]